MQTVPNKIYLTESELPRFWYNLRADLKARHDPLLDPRTHKPILDPSELEGIFCRELAKQELNYTDRYIDIPREIEDFYRIYRPSPLIRAYNLEKVLGTPANIYYKFEGGNTSGSHKLNSAAAQVYYAVQQGIGSLTTETGAGQWGTALSMACAHFNIPLTVYMVKASYEQKPFRKAVMATFGAETVASPSNTTAAGRELQKRFPDSSGSLGMAISEAVEKAVTTENCRYVLGSVLDQVLLHQSIVGLETKTALEKYGVTPDIMIACAGGGSNLGGFFSPFLGEKVTKGSKTRFIAVEPASCPSLTRGVFRYDFCDSGRIAPLAKMYTLGCGFVPSPIHAGGLRYHGMSPLVSQLYHDGIIDEARAITQTKIFDAAKVFAKAETILPAPESAHAIAVAIDEAKKCKETGEAKTIVFNLTGTGYFDMKAYTEYSEGRMTDYIPTDAELAKGFATIPKVDQKGLTV